MSSLNLAKCGNELQKIEVLSLESEGKIFNTRSQSAGKISENVSDLNWIACAIESEGSLQLAWGKTKYKLQILPRISLSNQSIEYLEKAVSIAGGNFNRKSYPKDNGCYHVMWYGMNNVKAVVEAILPYMIIPRKIKIAHTILEFINHRQSIVHTTKYGFKEKVLFMQVRELNGKGMISDDLLKFSFEKSSETTRQILFPFLVDESKDIVRSA